MRIQSDDDLITQIGLITTDPRWSHIESPLLMEFALAVIDALHLVPGGGFQVLERLTETGYEWTIRRVSE